MALSVVKDARTTADPEVSCIAIENEVIEHFVEISRALGQPRSFAEIYGLLFISPKPLSMDDLIVRLKISKGSVSQGLKFLRDIEAVRTVEIDDDRRVHYEAVAELRRLAGRFLRDQLAPRIAGNQKRLEKLSSKSSALGKETRQHAEARINMLKSWNKNTKRLLPIVVKILGA